MPKVKKDVFLVTLQINNRLLFGLPSNRMLNSFQEARFFVY